jgi:hypothetical protein
MKYLATLSGRFLTGSELAEALQSLSASLASHQFCEIVDIPIIDTDGVHRRAQVEAGYGAPITLVEAPAPYEELVEVDTVLQLYERAQTVGVVRGFPFVPDELDETDWSVWDDCITGF